MNKADKEYCDARHYPIEKYLDKLSKTQDVIDGRLWGLMRGGFLGMLFLFLNLAATIIMVVIGLKSTPIKPKGSISINRSAKIDSLLAKLDFKGVK